MLPSTLRATSLLSLVLLAGLAACSSQQMYGAGQGWQRQECQKINDLTTRQRCLAQANLPQERYEADVEAARGTKRDATK